MHDRVSTGFVLAALYNALIIVASKGFSSDLGAVDPLFSPLGCVLILLWGAAYFSSAKRYRTLPALALVFCLEKAVYAGHWAVWMTDHGGELGALIEADLMTGLFLSVYGVGDALFMIFFGWVSWRWRQNLWGTAEETQPEGE